MTTSEYRAHPALNFSLAKHLLDSPAHFKAALDEEMEPSEAMILGTVTHAYVLENKDIRDEYAIKPEGMSFATKEGKAWRDAQTKPILAESKAKHIPLAATAMSNQPLARKLLELAPHRETSILTEFRGVEIKALLDAHGDDIICDFKTTNDCSHRAFQRKIFDMHYDMQAAWYCVAYMAKYGVDEPPAWYWLACEMSQPYAHKIYIASPEIIASGMDKMEIAIAKYKECTASGKWELPQVAWEEMEMPHWK